MASQFNIKAADQTCVHELSEKLGLPQFIATCLVARGIKTPDQAQEFLNPSLNRDWLDPYIIPGMRAVVDGLEAAIRKQKRLVVFGDFDLDGISATALITRVLRRLGAAQVETFIPRRFEEGYALTPASTDRLLEMNPEVVLTVDCGISCKHEVARLVSCGVEVLISDHHEPSDLVPEGVPVCDPKLEKDCPSQALAGVGVALKISQALGGRFGQPHLWREYCDLASLGTIADLMPMKLGNRALVAEGVRQINESPRPALAALLGQAGVADKEVEATSLSFSLIPRLNAAGRMGDAELALRLLLSDNFDEACTLAAELEAVNDQRRAVEAELADIAKVQAEEVYHGERVLVVSGPGWHEGVKGIVASRLVSMYGVPSLLFSIEEGEARGSGRSVGAVNLFKAVESCADLLTRFGGHEAAVGLTLPAEKLPEFTARLNAYLETLPAEAFHPRIDIDAVVDLDELSIETVEMLKSLAPFGQENPQPKFLARNVSLMNCRAVGAEKNHLSCLLTQGRTQVAGIMFRCSDIENLMQCESVVNAAFELQVDEWKGRRNIKAMLKALSPAQPCVALEACTELNAENNPFKELYATSDEDLCADDLKPISEVEDFESKREENRLIWEKKLKDQGMNLRAEIIAACIGKSAQLHESQERTLDALEAGKSTLAVMATGRGKSLVFQVEAIRQALAENKVSLFIYPLRALIADQAFHLRKLLARFGLEACVLTGESTPEERFAALRALRAREISVVLTTPEFLAFHAQELKDIPFGFLVVDEAHHLAQAHAGNRPLYAEIGAHLGELGNPLVLATSATASSEISATICESLGLGELIVDETARTNLLLDDQRNLKSREQYLAQLVATGEKTVVYLNSREAVVALARTLRKLAPQVAALIGFYHGGLAREDRIRIEELFRKGALCTLVATSAFGEGLNIPDIKHVVLYQIPFNEIEFNQMAGRCGRNGQDAYVHLLYARADIRAAQEILSAQTPSHELMAHMYRNLKALCAQAPDGLVVDTLEGLCARIPGLEPRRALHPASLACALDVFRELGLINLHISYLEGKQQYGLRMVINAPRVELRESVRYQEGLNEQDDFAAFARQALSLSAETLLNRIAFPIAPQL